MRSLSETLQIDVAARSSSLSKAQVKEIYDELKKFHPHTYFNIHYMSTVGDRDQTTSLKTLGQTDFFTKDIDLWVLDGKERIGIHSAKDLPYPLRNGLTIFCVTKGIDSSDSLVLSSGKTIDSLPFGAMIATSSSRREEMVRQIRNDLTFCDIRGTIEQRLAKLEDGEINGVVIAEAALIRLNLIHLNRIKLPGKTAEGQGQLAVVGREEETHLKTLFQCLDTR